jgi:hypothetical protein
MNVAWLLAQPAGPKLSQPVHTSCMTVLHRVGHCLNSSVYGSNGEALVLQEFSLVSMQLS